LFLFSSLEVVFIYHHRVVVVIFRRLVLVRKNLLFSRVFY